MQCKLPNGEKKLTERRARARDFGYVIPISHEEGSDQRQQSISAAVVMRNGCYDPQK